MGLFSAPAISTSAFAQNAVQTGTENLTATTDQAIYQYGQTIHLKIEDMNNGPAKSVSALSSKYLGIHHPCGIPYFDFVMLQGDYANITSYDQLASLKDKILDVVQAAPDNAILCPFNVKEVRSVSMDANSHNATRTIVTSQGNIMTQKEALITSFDIKNVYGNVVYKQIDANQTLEYRESQSLPVGKYMIIAFNLAGKISQPLTIEVTNSSIGSSTEQTNTGLHTNTIADSTPQSGIAYMSLIGIPAAFGGVIIMAYRRSNRLTGSFTLPLVFIVVILSIVQAINSNAAFATYNVSSQGVEAHGTNSLFTQATVEHRFEGAVTDKGTKMGLSTQNNQFLSHFTVGTNFLWSQSVIQMETQSTANYNPHTCTTQGGSYTCKLPTSVKLGGLYNFWTDHGIFNSCPTSAGFSYDTVTGQCVNAPTMIPWKTVSLTSSNTRIDLNTYQEIQSTGKIYNDQKYRTCTSSGCTGYTPITSYTTPTAYGQYGNFYYDIGFFQGTSTYGVEALVGQCESCDTFSNGRVDFYDGTYVTQTYSTNGGGNPFYRAGGATVLPDEENSDLCWWNSISNTGGSSPTFTTTAKYNTSCSS